MAARSEQGDRTSNALRPTMSSTSPPSAGDPLPANCELIEVHVSELKQLFNAIDPSPFREQILDPGAEEFIADWAREASPSATLGLTVHLDQQAKNPNKPAELREAIHEFYRHRAELSDAGCASSFAVAGRAWSLASAHSASRWRPEISSGASSASHLAEILGKEPAGSADPSQRRGPWKSPLRLVAGRSRARCRRQTERDAGTDLVQQDGSADAWRWDSA